MRTKSNGTSRRSAPPPESAGSPSRRSRRESSRRFGDRSRRGQTKREKIASFIREEQQMYCKSNLAVLIALAVGSACGWAGASGKFDSLLNAEQKATS